MKRKPSWRPNLGLRMFEFIKPSPYEHEELPPAPRPRPQEDSRRPYYGREEEYRPRLPYREGGGSMIVAPQSSAPRRDAGMFDWVKRSPRYVPPPPRRDEDIYTEEELESIPSIDGWRSRTSMGAAGSSSGWLVGLSVAVGFGIAAALAYFSMPGQQTKA